MIKLVLVLMSHDIDLPATYPPFPLQWAVLLLAPRALLQDKVESVRSCATPQPTARSSRFKLAQLACPSACGVQHTPRLIFCACGRPTRRKTNTDLIKKLIHECTGICASQCMYQGSNATDTYQYAQITGVHTCVYSG
jgi:hypothetical protein